MALLIISASSPAPPPRCRPGVVPVCRSRSRGATEGGGNRSGWFAGWSSPSPFALFALVYVIRCARWPKRPAADVAIVVPRRLRLRPPDPGAVGAGRWVRSRFTSRVGVKTPRRDGFWPGFGPGSASVSSTRHARADPGRRPHLLRLRSRSTRTASRSSSPTRIGSAIVLSRDHARGRRLAAPLRRRSGAFQMAMGRSWCSSPSRCAGLRHQSSSRASSPTCPPSCQSPPKGSKRSGFAQHALAEIRSRRQPRHRPQGAGNRIRRWWQGRVRWIGPRNEAGVPSGRIPPTLC